MQKVRLEEYVPKAREVSNRVRRRLEDILHMELSLSVARGILNGLDSVIQIPFLVETTWHGHNVFLNIQSDQRTIIRDFLKTYPNCFVDKEYLIIGQRGGPCVIMCVSRIDMHSEGAT